MKRSFAFMIVLSCCFSILVSQVRTIKPIKSHPSTALFSFGFGAAGSVLFLSRNVKPDNEARGYQASLVYGGSKLFRGSLEYTRYQTINIEPTWYNIKAQSIECNMHILARFNESKAVFYPIFGLSYNTFKGFYTGVNDYLNLSSLYSVNQDVVTHWLGFNVGTGFECYFNRLSFYADYKMRLGVSEGYNEFNIIDVCLSAGIRYNFKVPSLYSLVKGTRSRYILKSD